jgi:isopenicillin-N epimerase
MTNLKSDFLIDPEVIFLNHGSFGACPRPVFEAYQNWQIELENQPVEFLSRRAPELLAEARSDLAHFLNAEPDDVVYFPNPTTAINMVARNLDLQPGDEILATDHEYGAMERTWRFICEKIGARYIQKPIPIPVTNRNEIVDSFLQGVTDRTRVIFISHITSPTALIFPVAEICRKAHQAGLFVIVDGAHSPGHIPLNLKEINADIYTGACHKWLCAPKGASFLYADQKIQPILDPLVVSWGYQGEKPGPSQFIDYHEWQGTRDLAAFLSVPTAIKFQQEHHWHTVQERCHNLAMRAREKINALTGFEPTSPNSLDWFGQMVAVRIPDTVNHEELQVHLYDNYNIEVPIYRWQDRQFIRISFQAYNPDSDLDVLLQALEDTLSLFTTEGEQ